MILFLPNRDLPNVLCHLRYLQESGTSCYAIAFLSYTWLEM